jgi:hypothetical protein
MTVTLNPYLILILLAMAFVTTLPVWSKEVRDTNPRWKGVAAFLIVIQAIWIIVAYGAGYYA